MNWLVNSVRSHGGVLALFTIYVGTFAALYYFLSDLFLVDDSPNNYHLLFDILIKAAAALAIAIGGYFTLQTVRNAQETLRLSQEGQITSRFSTAVEQLGAIRSDGSKALEIRLGAIYALERIARDSARDHWQVMEILTAYLRSNAPADSIGNCPKCCNSVSLEVGKAEPDIQAIATVLSRRVHTHYEVSNILRLDLSSTNLSNIEFDGIQLQGADFEASQMCGAKFRNSNLSGLMVAQGCWRNALISDHTVVQDVNFQDVDTTDMAISHSARLIGCSSLSVSNPLQSVKEGD